MNLLLKTALYAITTVPVLIVLRMFFPESTTWWQDISAGVVSGMIADYWLRQSYPDNA